MTGATDDSPETLGVWVTTEVMSCVEPASVEAVATEVKTLVDEGSTVVVLGEGVADVVVCEATEDAVVVEEGEEEAAEEVVD